MFGEIIKKIRTDMNMSLREFEKVVCLDHSTINILEKEQSSPKCKPLSPTINILKQICDKTNYPFRKFLVEAGYIEELEIETLFNKLSQEKKALALEYLKNLLNEEKLD